MRAKSVEIWVKCVNTFAKIVYVLWFYKNGTQNQSADFYWRSCFYVVDYFSGKLGEIWAKMVLVIPWFEKMRPTWKEMQSFFGGLGDHFLWVFVRPCMHLNYGVISGSHACRDCGWHIILVAELYTTCPGERVLVTTKFNVTFLPLRLCYVHTSTCFSKDAENLTTYGYVLWCSQIVCTRHYSLNTKIAFYSVNEWSNFAVSVWSMACQATTLSHFT